MREIARAQQGFFPTQDRIVHAIANLFKLPGCAQSPVVVLDAGCGIGQAIHDLSEAWRTEQPDLNVTLLGIESDKSRFEQAAKLLQSTGGGTALWSAIEDATVDQPFSLIWFNPPGGGRKRDLRIGYEGTLGLDVLRTVNFEDSFALLRC